MGALSVELTTEQRARLDAVSALESVHPYMYFGETFQNMITGGVRVHGFR